MGRMWQNREQEFKDLSRTVAAGMHNRAYRSTAAREQKKATRLKDLLSKRTWLGFSSDNYRSMQTAVRNYLEAETRLAERLKAANTEEAKRSSTYQGARDAVVTQEDLERLQQLSVRMKNAAQTYLNGKLVNGQVPADASDYTKQRIQAARLILDYGAQGEEIRPEEIRKAEANEAEANRQIARRKDIQVGEIPKTPEIPGIPRQGVGMG